MTISTAMCFQLSQFLQKLQQIINYSTVDVKNDKADCTCGTALLPKMPFNTAIDLPMMTSSLTFSMMAAASPATSASRTGALYRFQNKNNSPRLAVVLPTWPNRLAFGSQKIRSKHSTTWHVNNTLWTKYCRRILRSSKIFVN